MKRILFISALMLCSVAYAQFRTVPYSNLDDSETVKALRRHIEFLSSPALEGRGAGTDGETEAAIYLTQGLAAYGAEVISGDEGEVFGMKQENGDTLCSRNVIACIPGYDKNLKDHYIVIGARMDNIRKRKLTVNGEERETVFYGANGNASGMAMLLELARMLETNSSLLRRSVLFVGFGSSTETFAGAWYFLNRSFKDADKIDAMIDLDMLGKGSGGFYAYTASNPDMNVIVNTLSQSLQPILPELTGQMPYPSDNMAFYDASIPSIMFTTGFYPEHNTEKDVADIIQYDFMERELEYIYNYSVSLINGPKPIFNVREELKKRGPENKAVPYYDCDRPPIFLGSTDPKAFLEKWVYKYLKYPEQAVREGIQGKVLVNFVVDEKGKVTNVQVLKGVDPLLDDEALRVIKASPDWKPGLVRGQKVKAELSLYVEFRLKKRK